MITEMNRCHETYFFKPIRWEVGFPIASGSRKNFVKFFSNCTKKKILIPIRVIIVKPKNKRASLTDSLVRILSIILLNTTPSYHYCRFLYTLRWNPRAIQALRKLRMKKPLIPFIMLVELFMIPHANNRTIFDHEYCTGMADR